MKRASVKANSPRPPFVPGDVLDDLDSEPRAWALKWNGAALGQPVPGVPVASVTCSTYPQRA